MKIVETGGIPMELILKTDYASLYFESNLKLAVCVADEEYIPIDSFKSLFLAVSDLLEVKEIKHFVFDKRQLRTFHQPSMEWYFAIWKTSVREKGLVDHYKILPPLDWFVKAVDAGKWEIFKKYGSDIVNGISINYVDSIDEVVLKLKG
ncbi:MAG: hypothetical protein IPO32_07635 [Crocinitomicaceae bacterium]|jgi:hypothetical protein|nr:hypothetical protein [Crocinitomicaceae bacterium]MBK9591368.1 hypothetical protein [Crocinitomicaceae bacterium]